MSGADDDCPVMVYTPLTGQLCVCVGFFVVCVRAHDAAAEATITNWKIIRNIQTTTSFMIFTRHQDRLVQLWRVPGHRDFLQKENS